MEVPLGITFHNMPSSKKLSAEIGKRVAKLEKLYGRLIGCRVSVEELNKPHRNGNIYEVHIEMQAPGGQFVVSREPHHIKERHPIADAKIAVRDAFDVAEAQLRSFHRKHRAKLRKSRTAWPASAKRGNENYAMGR